MKLPKTERGEKTRQKLLRAAESVFGERGFFDASIGEITSKAGVGSGTFYIYYDSKVEVFKDVIMNLNHELRKSISVTTSHLKSRQEIESVGFREFFDFVKRHKKFYRIIRQAEYVDPELFKWYYRKIAEGYSEGLKTSMQAGEFSNNDSELISYALMGIADFVGMRYVMWGDEVDGKRFGELMHFIFNGLLNNRHPPDRPSR